MQGRQILHSQLHAAAWWQSDKEDKGSEVLQRQSLAADEVKDKRLLDKPVYCSRNSTKLNIQSSALIRSRILLAEEASEDASASCRRCASPEATKSF